MPVLDGIRSRVRRTVSTAAVLRLLIVLSLVGPTAFVTFSALQSRALLLDGTASRAARMAELLAQHAAATFDAYNHAFSRIEEYLGREGALDERALHAYLGTIDREMNAVDGLTLLGPDWVPLAHSRYFPIAKVYVGDRDYIRNLPNGPRDGAAARDRTEAVTGRDGLVIGVPLTSRYSGQVVLVGARARRNADGGSAGALVVTLSPSYFEDIFRTLALSARDRVALVRADSRVLAQVPALPGRTAIDPDAAAKPNFIPAAVAAGEAPGLVEGTRDYISPVDGTRRISGLHRLAGYPLFVELGYDVEAVLEPWRRRLVLDVVVAVLATLVFYGAARLGLSKVRTEAAMQELVLAETRQRVEAETALGQAQKMEALGQLTGGIAHDFNNLLNVVLINLELAAKRLSDAREKANGTSDSAKVDLYVQGATQGAERGVALTRRLLTFAHRQEEETVELRVSDLVFGLRDLLGQAVGSRVRITLDCPTGLPPVRTEPNALETALLNLVVNAREAMPEGGRTHISAREETERAESGRGGVRFVVLAVKDDGVGMDAAMLARAREPFFTTKPAGTGSGLGLATVDRYASRADGRLRIVSEPGLGTTAEIWLPAAA